MSHAQSDAAPQDGLLSRVFSWLVTHHVREGEVATLSLADMRDLARDIGVSEADLTTMVTNGTDNRALTDQMIRAHGLDPAVIRSLPSALLRDLETTCARCGSHGRCQRDLAAGTAAVHCPDYCGNADALEALASSIRHSCSAQGRPER